MTHRAGAGPLAKDAKIMGLILDTRLTMKAHISSTYQKAMGTPHQILTLKNILPPHYLTNLYKQCVWPILEFGMIGYMHASEAELKRLENVQKLLFIKSRGSDVTEGVGTWNPNPPRLVNLAR
eukprot:Filipodium_phascolosomae@DN2824_c0_g1_i1.p2